MPNAAEFILCLIEQTMTFVFFSSLLEKRFKSIIPTILVVFTNALVIFLCTDIKLYLRAIILNAITILGSQILYKEKPHIKISFTVMIDFLFIIIDVVFGLLFSLIMDKQFYDVFFGSPLRRIILSLFIKAVNVIVIYVVYKLLKKTHFEGSRKTWVLFSLVMTTFLFVGVTFIEMYQNSPGAPETTLLFFAVSTAFFITGMIIIFFFAHICRSFFNEKKMIVLESNYEGVKEQLAVRSNNSEKLGKIRHDIKNHLLNAKQLISQNQYDAAQTLVDEMIGQTDSIELFSEAATGNDFIDATLAVKAAICKSQNIRFDLSYEKLPQLKISEIDLSSLFSNILDNAITAAEKTDAPYISLTIFIRGDYLNIVSENSYTGEIKKSEKGKNAILSTTKSNSAEHGFGTKIISEIAEKYDGVCVCGYGNGVFKMNVMLKIN